MIGAAGSSTGSAGAYWATYADVRHEHAQCADNEPLRQP